MARRNSRGDTYQRKRNQLLLMRKLPLTADVVWTQVHESLGGNGAHTPQPERTLSELTPQPEVLDHDPLPLQYSTILQRYRFGRRTYSPLHDTLTREEAVAWHQFQTNTCPHLSKLHLIYPALYPRQCHLCGEHASLLHTTWACYNTPNIPSVHGPSDLKWKATLSSSDPRDQQELVWRVGKTDRLQEPWTEGPSPTPCVDFFARNKESEATS